MAKQRDYLGEIDRITTAMRRARVLELRDEFGLTFAQIGERFGVTWQRAQKLYNDAKRDTEAAAPEVPA